MILLSDVNRILLKYTTEYRSVHGDDFLKKFDFQGSKIPGFWPKK